MVQCTISYGTSERPLRMRWKGRGHIDQYLTQARYPHETYADTRLYVRTPSSMVHPLPSLFPPRSPSIPSRRLTLTTPSTGPQTPKAPGSQVKPHVTPSAPEHLHTSSTLLTLTTLPRHVFYIPNTPHPSPSRHLLLLTGNDAIPSQTAPPARNILPSAAPPALPRHATPRRTPPHVPSSC